MNFSKPAGRHPELENDVKATEYGRGVLFCESSADEESARNGGDVLQRFGRIRRFRV